MLDLDLATAHALGLDDVPLTQVLEAKIMERNEAPIVLHDARLGQLRTTSITLDLYSHLIPGMQEDAANRIDATLRTHLERKP